MDWDFKKNEEGEVANPLTYKTFRERALDTNTLQNKGDLYTKGEKDVEALLAPKEKAPYKQANEVLPVEYVLKHNKSEIEIETAWGRTPYVILKRFPPSKKEHQVIDTNTLYLEDLDKNTLYFVMGSYDVTGNETYKGETK